MFPLETVRQALFNNYRTGKVGIVGHPSDPSGHSSGRARDNRIMPSSSRGPLKILLFALFLFSFSIVVFVVFIINCFFFHGE